MKQTKLWLVAIAVLLCSLTANAYDFKVEGIYYNITSEEDFTVEVTYGIDYSGAVTIPTTINYNDVEYSVTSIGNSAFYGCSSLTSITIPKGVTEIGSYAFEGCSSLTSITIPENSQLTSIGQQVFANCSNLASITFPENSQLTSIKTFAFYGCSSLANITLPESLTSIGYGAFQNCSGLTTITIPEGVTSIEIQAFLGCSSLTSITIPENSQLTSIGSSAFLSCSNLTDITIPEGVTSIGDRAFDNCSSLTSITIPESVTSIGVCTFYDCGSLTNITLPESMTSIGYGAFHNCSSLTSITIPESVTSIGDRAFLDCFRLTFITCKAATPPTIGGSDTFYWVDKSIPVYVPAGYVEAYKVAEGWREFTNILPLANEYTLTVSSAGYATLYLDYAVEIPEKVEVYIASSVEGDRLMMTEVEGVLPANTGVIVKANPGTYAFVESDGIPADVQSNLLTGTTTNTYITAAPGYKYYVLAQKDGMVGMYRPKLTNGQFLNNANKAYLALESSDLGIFDDETNTEDEGGQLSNRLRFDFGGSTGLDNSEIRNHDSETIFDLSGRRVTHPAKGIYIVNGRKVVIK